LLYWYKSTHTDAAGAYAGDTLHSLLTQNFHPYQVAYGRMHL
jgi:hypothetical protein